MNVAPRDGIGIGVREACLAEEDFSDGA